MRIFLQQPPAAGEPTRYHKFTLEQDLLGSWWLHRESGQVGGRATAKREVYPGQAEALAAFEAARDAQLKRGFRITFSEGAEAPRR
jgi:predicted DNA-binding WGR domain protein